MNTAVRLIMDRATNHDGFYDGTLDELPWSFWLQELTLPKEDVSRLLRVWNGEYLSYRQYGGAPCFRHLYTFRDLQGRLGSLSISDNMGFQYFRWFHDGDHLTSELRRLGEPVDYHRGLPAPAEILQLDLTPEQRERALAAAQSIVVAYLSGGDLPDKTLNLVRAYEQAFPEQETATPVEGREPQ